MYDVKAHFENAEKNLLIPGTPLVGKKRQRDQSESREINKLPERRGDRRRSERPRYCKRYMSSKMTMKRQIDEYKYQSFRDQI